MASKNSIFFKFTFVSFYISIYGNLINVAVDNSAHQGGSVGNPWKAVDGNTETRLHYGTCTSTETLVRPFWEVDLGSIYTIYFIRVYGRSDCCAERLGNVFVETSSYGVMYETFGYYSGQMPIKHEFRPNIPLAGRWLKLTLEKIEILTLCEVQVYTRDPNENNNLKMKLVGSVKGDGQIININTNISLLQCAQQCLLDRLCFSINVIEIVTSHPEIECQLLGSASYSPTLQTNIRYYELGQHKGANFAYGR